MPLFGEGSEVVLATSGVRARVERVLGEGGQGTVYEVAYRAMANASP